MPIGPNQIRPSPPPSIPIKMIPIESRALHSSPTTHRRRADRKKKISRRRRGKRTLPNCKEYVEYSRGWGAGAYNIFSTHPERPRIGPVIQSAKSLLHLFFIQNRRRKSRRRIYPTPRSPDAEIWIIRGCAGGSWARRATSPRLPEIGRRTNREVYGHNGLRMRLRLKMVSPPIFARSTQPIEHSLAISAPPSPL